MLKVGVVGVGHIGSVIAAELALRGSNVIAIDLDSRKVNSINNKKAPISEPGLEELITLAIDSGNLKASTELSLISEVDAVLITVGTPIVDGIADLSALKNVCESIAKILKKKTLVMIKSTVPPGTTRDVVAPIIGINHYLAFVPERLAEGQAIADFRNLPMVLGGINLESKEQAVKFWEQLNFEVIQVSDCTAAELVKLADNAWIDLNIAFGHELAQICDAIGTDVMEVIHAANTLAKGSSYVNILLPSVGVGGYCLTKDPYFLADFAASKGVDIKLSRQGRHINENSPAYLYREMQSLVVDLQNKKILCIGISFKTNSGDVRFSPAIDFLQLMDKDEVAYEWYDPLVINEDISEKLRSSRLSSLPENRKFDVIAILAAHDCFGSLNYQSLSRYLEREATIVDGRRFFRADEINEIINNGINFVGVGRTRR